MSGAVNLTVMLIAFHAPWCAERRRAAVRCCRLAYVDELSTSRLLDKRHHPVAQPRSVAEINILPSLTFDANARRIKKTRNSLRS